MDPIPDPMPPTQPSHAQPKGGGMAVKVVVIVICLAAAGYFAYQNLQDPEETSYLPTPAAGVERESPAAPPQEPETAPESPATP